MMMSTTVPATATISPGMRRSLRKKIRTSPVSEMIVSRPAEMSMTADQTGAGVAALVQVVDDGDEAVIELSQVVMARLAVDEGVGGIAGALEADRALVLVDAEVRQCAADAVRLAQVLDDLQFRDLLGSDRAPAGSRRPVMRAST